MRKIERSSTTSCSARLIVWALERSRPSGFSTTTRALVAQPELPSLEATSANRLGGMAR